VCPGPNTIYLDREINRHTSFGLGVPRRIESNVARTGLHDHCRQVFERMSDYFVDASGNGRDESVGV